jgi:hypothetical protein
MRPADDHILGSGRPPTMPQEQWPLNSKLAVETAPDHWS